MYGIIATWRMALEGITKADEMLKNHGDAGDAIVEAVKAVEDFPYYKSVGSFHDTCTSSIASLPSVPDILIYLPLNSLISTVSSISEFLPLITSFHSLPSSET